MRKTVRKSGRTEITLAVAGFPLGGSFGYGVSLPDFLTVFRIQSYHHSAECTAFVVVTARLDFFERSYRDIQSSVIELDAAANTGKRMFIHQRFPDEFTVGCIDGIGIPANVAKISDHLIGMIGALLDENSACD